METYHKPDQRPDQVETVQLPADEANQPDAHRLHRPNDVEGDADPADRAALWRVAQTRSGEARGQATNAKPSPDEKAAEQKDGSNRNQQDAPNVHAARPIQKPAETARTVTPFDRPHMNCSRLTSSTPPGPYLQLQFHESFDGTVSAAMSRARSDSSGPRRSSRPSARATRRPRHPGGRWKSQLNRTSVSPSLVSVSVRCS